MARTRGGSSQGERRERSMASVHRRDRQEGGEDVPVNVTTIEAFPRRPTHGSFLVSYRDHVAFNLWECEVSIFYL